MKLKIIEGGRDELERKVLETIWIGSLEEADRLISKLQTLPQPDLRLVSNRVSINIENFPPINIQKFPVGMRKLMILDSHFPLL
jgi:hypothetical protein